MIDHMDTFEADLVFLGISTDCDDVISVLERSEYDVVLGRLADTDAAAVFSSSELLSGMARFFPLESLAGSLIDNVEVGGKVARRALRNQNISHTACFLTISK